jgi:hypothetical protein
MTRSAPALVVLACVAALATAMSVSAARSGEGSLAFNAIVSGPLKVVACPSGLQAECFRYQGEGHVSGLGTSSLTYTLVWGMPKGGDDPCRVWSANDAVMVGAGKGEIRLPASDPSCQGASGTIPFVITSGSGAYAGATGSGTMKGVVTDTAGSVANVWTGTLNVAGLDFDTTPPAISGASNKVVKVKKGARGARVRYAVTASDAVDGARSVTCAPRSGSYFRLGKTKVRCSATDSSANPASASFTVAVKLR